MTFTQEGDAAVYIVTTENEDGSITETIYTFREAVVSLSSPEAKQAAWEALAKAENKTVQQLKDEATPSVTSSLILSPNPPGPWRPGPARPRRRTKASTRKS